MAADCHGLDLLSAPDVRRPLPILFSATTNGQVARVGMLVRPDRKLVVDLRDADARLLRLEKGSMLEEDVSSEEREELALRLTELVRMPLYSRQR